MATVDEQTEALIERHRKVMREIGDRDRAATFRLASLNNMGIYVNALGRTPGNEDLAKEVGKVIIKEVIAEHLTMVRNVERPAGNPESD